MGEESKGRDVEGETSGQHDRTSPLKATDIYCHKQSRRINKERGWYADRRDGGIGNGSGKRSGTCHGSGK